MTGASMVGPLTEELASRSRDSLRRELRILRTAIVPAEIAAREAWIEEALIRSWRAMQEAA